MEIIHSIKTHMHKLLSLVTLSIGVLLMIFMITTEDEPGAIPLILIVIGIAWLLISKFKKK